MILALKTDGAATDIYLLSSEGVDLAHEHWESGRSLADGLLGHLTGLLQKQDKNIGDVSGVIIFRGPGSFTSLRIGITTANALARTLKLPIVGAEGDNWLASGLRQLPKAEVGAIILPLYDREPNITKPKV